MYLNSKILMFHASMANSRGNKTWSWFDDTL